MTPSTLDAIGLRHGTDKASSHHNYLQFYERFFASLRDKTLTVLEIGVFGGASLKTWAEYFPNAKVVGVDIAAASRMYETGRVTIVLADQANIEELTSIGIEHGPFDIIIEDGSHMWNHQITSLRALFPFLKNGGLYVVEDLQTNYGSMQADYKGVATSTCVDYLKAWLDLRVGDDQIPIAHVEDAFLRTYGRAVEFITFYRRACLIKKQFNPVAREIGAGRPIITRNIKTESKTVSILAHLGNLGDVVGLSGFVNRAFDKNVFQGIAIDCPDEIFEYRVRYPDGTWSTWTQRGNFAGTRGQSKPLTGFTIRLLGSTKERYGLCAVGRFAGSGDPVEVADGQDCLTKSGGELCGIQVLLLHVGNAG
jgi:Clostridial hydrophobic W